MKEYLLIFRLTRDGNAKPSADQIQARKAWFGKVVSDQRLADRGNTLSPSSAKVINADATIVEGPCISNGQFVSGYMVVKSESIDDAVEIARSNPIFAVGGSIEVREVATFIAAE